MSPIEKFQRVLCTLKLHFQFVKQDIFDENYQFGKGYYLILCLYPVIIFNYLYTLGFFDQSLSEVLMCLAYFTGNVQVNWETGVFKLF